MSIFDAEGLGAPASQARTAVRKFLVVVDDAPEYQVALRYGALRAARSGGKLTLLQVLPPSDFKNWGGVDQLIQAEAREQAEMLMQQLADKVHDFIGMIPEILIRQGDAREQVLAAIAADPAIRVLVLASPAKGKPGALVAAFTAAGALPIPLQIVPGHLTAAEIDEIA